MRLILLTCITMCAFAANSVLNRLAVDNGTIDPSSFAVIRVLAGALGLCMLVVLRGQKVPIASRARFLSAISLSVYMIGFSMAYVTLDAGLGALILFGVVQVSMFGWGALRGSQPTLRQLAGAAIAFTGLIVALWPSDTGAADLTGAAFMVFAGLGWAGYTLAGRTARDPLAATAANFLVAVPILLVLLFGAGLHAGPVGIALAVLSGAVTSGLGYALWYHVLPQLASQSAAVVQLSVPVIAIAAGAAFLNEAISISVVGAAVLVLGGIALAVTVPKSRADHS